MNLHFLIIVSILALRSNAGGGYAANCNNISLVDTNGHTGLRAQCASTTGTDPQCSILDLNACYTYDNHDITPHEQ